MKKSGWDYSLKVLNLAMETMLPILVLLFNTCFYIAYPIKLGISILYALPKKGNLRLPENYRGIQVQPLLAILYDRIIANRLMLWAKFRPEQSAFQKGKGTIDQIFLLRTIISLAKSCKTPLFIAFLDLEKAFDKVSRHQLLKALLKAGIGASIFYAIKSMYSITKCILKSGYTFSEIFMTYSGIKQGAPSSVILFLIFMDDCIVEFLDTCIDETVIGNLHILLHADDTVLLGTERSSFVSKCNNLINTFTVKRMSLNIGKSGFMIINSSDIRDRSAIKLENGWLKYRDEFVYLGVMFTDSGSVHNDLELHARSKNKSVLIKLANFIRNNQFAPTSVKRKVLNACLKSAILYGQETWGGSSLAKIETLYRKSIKITFGLNTRVPNEILYLETGFYDLKAEIYKSQYRFWSKIKKNITNDPDTNIAILYSTAIHKNVQYLRHYKKLHTSFANENDCFKQYRDSFIVDCKKNIIEKANSNSYSTYNDYFSLNRNLNGPEFYHKYTTWEFNRLIVTKYRTGSHYLHINTGRAANIPRNDRVCKCGQLQTLCHVLFNCIHTRMIKMALYANVNDLELFFALDIEHVAFILSNIEKELKLR